MQGDIVVVHLGKFEFLMFFLKKKIIKKKLLSIFAFSYPFFPWVVLVVVLVSVWLSFNAFVVVHEGI